MAEKMSERLYSDDLIPLTNKARLAFLDSIAPVCCEVDDLDIALRAYDESLAQDGLVLVRRDALSALQSEAEAAQDRIAGLTEENGSWRRVAERIEDKHCDTAISNLAGLPASHVRRYAVSA